MNKIIFVALLFTSFHLNGQDLQISSDGKTKTFKAGTFVEVSLPTATQEQCDECPIYTMAGQIVSYQNGRLHLKVKTSTEPIVSEKVRIGSQTKTYTSSGAAPVMEIPKDIILSVTKKGNKKLRGNSTSDVIGIILTVLGIGHLTGGAVLEIADNDGGLLLALGAAELLTGVVIGVTTRQKAFITSPVYPGTSGNEKIWKLE